MTKRDFLAIPDFSRDELTDLFQLALRMKRGEYRDRPFAGRTLGMAATLRDVTKRFDEMKALRAAVAAKR